MIRAVDSHGGLIIGLSRAAVEELLATGRCATSTPQGPEDLPLVVYIYVGETDEKAMENMVNDYGGERPLHTIDNRSS